MTLNDRYSLFISKQSLIHKLRVGLIVFIFHLMQNPFLLRLALSPFRGILKPNIYIYLAANFYVPFFTVFLNKFLDNKPKSFFINDIDDDSDNIDASEDIDHVFDTELELLIMMNALNINMMPILYHPFIRISKSNIYLQNMDSKHS
ncbi:hypothetical protein CUMW_269400 [Citrus unshiu]|uniref:Uncharacterized protein n=1 Tax=Citrus unshiu TaxID=55188 RepID=A0A2H5QWV4_CITUN|nr:hypothetical protein CUMW_269400 [Citrus unshiu]